MQLIADFHIHSHFSRATSKTLVPEYLAYYAGLKGIQVVGTGDFTHPGWLAELKEKTESDGSGLLRLKKEYQKFFPSGNGETRFLLTAEISNIYKRGGQVRKVHNLVLVPGFDEAEKINRRLVNLGGNLTSDGRPILGLDSRDLLEIVLDCNENNYFIPAHIWTPWFSVLGSKSGFDSLDACFADLSPHIHTIETGLSTDPPMNWLCSFLDRVALVSNSDAHSPERLGRNANIFNTGCDYFSLTDALRTGDPHKFSGTIDMFPQEGKYHYDGHRKCNICWDPAETLQNNSICPVCKKPVTVGVMNRVIRLSDREDWAERPNRLPFWSIIPLSEILAEIEGVGENSKKVEARYLQVLQKLGPELGILLEVPIDEIEKKTGPTLAEAIRRMRNREVIIQEGYDGEYGVVKVFRPGEMKTFEASRLLFQMDKTTPPLGRAFINFDLKGFRDLFVDKDEPENQVAEKAGTYSDQLAGKTPFAGLNNEQLAAVQNVAGPSLIIAGPGTGKTKTLTAKIAWLIENRLARPDEILAVTFTNKAAGELKERLQVLLRNKADSGKVTVATFHGFGLAILKEFFTEFGRTNQFILAGETLRLEIIQHILERNLKEAKKLAAGFSEIKKGSAAETTDFRHYESELQKMDVFDLDDLLEKPLHLFLQHEDIITRFRKNFRYIFVDEYQDVNETQYQLLRLLSPAPDSNLCVVGDANQSIYSFRGANASYISKFTDDYSNAGVFRLTRSYRCTQTILSASANVLSQGDNFLEGLNEGIRIAVSEQPTGAAEAEFVARQIVDLVGGVSFFSIDSAVTKGDKIESVSSLSDLAVLCRTRNQFEAFAKAFSDHNIPFQETGTAPFFQEEPFQQLTDLISALSFESYERAALVFSIKEMQVSKLQFLGAREKMTESGLIPFLNSVKENYFPAGSFKEDDWLRFIGLATEMGNLQELLAYVRLGAGSDAYSKNLEAVSLMTLHASKGLEFECVFIPGCENGLLPYNLFQKEVDVDEEKRLLYVGMTRAKKLLYLTSARSRTIRGRKFNLPKSPFLNAIQQELIQQIKNNPSKKPVEKNNQLSLFE